MGRMEDPRVETVFKMADRGMPLQEAWAKYGKPGTWGSVQRRYKARPPPSATNHQGAVSCQRQLKRQAQAPAEHAGAGGSV